MESMLTLYVVSESGLDLNMQLLWDTVDEAEQYNEEQFGGNATVFELTVSLDWSKAVRVE